MANVRAVVTGASGMIGAALIRECIANGWEVLALVRPGSAHNDRIPEHPLVRVAECALESLENYDYDCDADDLRADVFYHLGWSGTSPALRRDVAVQMKNIEYTLAAVRLAVRLGCRKFVGAGSQAEYGSADCVKAPETPVSPETAYGAAKYAAGAAARLECLQHGIDCFWVRIFSVYGQFDLETTMISSALSAFERGERPRFTPAEQRWDYLECGDAARALRLIGERAQGVKVYCLGSGQSSPLREYIETLRDVAAPGAPLGIGELDYPSGRPVDLCADISALTRDVGFVPSVSFADGVRTLVASRRTDRNNR